MNNRTYFFIIIMLLAASAAFWFWMFQKSSAAAETADSEVLEITMYRGEGCNCCMKWADYLEENGFEVTDKKVEDLFEVKDKYGVPYDINSCHTAVVKGYVVEGHVPAEDIRRLLAEQPEAIGISVPGMPPGAPGMDAPVSRTYQTILFDSGERTVFNVHD